MVRAQQELVHQYGVQVVSLEHELIKAMREESGAARVRWDIVLRADRADAGSADWQNLRNLVRRALPRVAPVIAAASPPVLVTCPGLLDRYGEWPWLADLAQTVGRAGGIHGLWLLVPWDDQTSPPTLGRGAVPVLPSQLAHIPDGWLANRHRAA